MNMSERSPWRYTRLIAELNTLPASSPLVKRLSRYVQAHLFEPVTLAAAAETLGYRKSYLCTEFKKATGETVTHYIQKRFPPVSLTSP